MAVRRDMSDDYTRCRTYNHAWFEADSDWKTNMGTPLTLRCERCMTERRDVINRFGELVVRHYRYPKGYQYAAGTAPTKNDFRLQLLALRLRERREARKAAKK